MESVTFLLELLDLAFPYKSIYSVRMKAGGICQNRNLRYRISPNPIYHVTFLSEVFLAFLKRKQRQAAGGPTGSFLHEVLT